jgi:hypothetical protein
LFNNQLTIIYHPLLVIYFFFRINLHQNDVFLFFLKLFLRSAHQNIKKLNFLQKKIKFFKNNRVPKHSLQVRKSPFLLMFGVFSGRGKNLNEANI